MGGQSWALGPYLRVTDHPLGWGDKFCVHNVSPEGTALCPLADLCWSCPFPPYPTLLYIRKLGLKTWPWHWLTLGLDWHGDAETTNKMMERQVFCFLGRKASLWRPHEIIPILVHVHNPGIAAWNISRPFQGSHRPDEMSQDFSTAAAEAPVGYVGCAHRKQEAKPHFLLALYLSMCRNYLWCCPLANGDIYNYNLLLSAYYVQSSILNLCHDFSTEWFSRCIPGNPRRVPKTLWCVCELKKFFIIILRCYFPFSL